MKITVEDTLEQYEKLYGLEPCKREDFFRYTMMKPFEAMWRFINVPLHAKEPGGYDVVMAAKMLGHLDLSETETGTHVLQNLKEIGALSTAKEVLHACTDFTLQHGLKIHADELKLGLYIADPHKLELVNGYSGFGGIPGFIQVTIYPNNYNIPRIPAVIAHEFHHNIRFSYFDWDHGNITVGEYLIIEGLAESFARELYGQDSIGPWVTSLDEEDEMYSIQVLKNALNIKGFAEVSSYMFGDIYAKEQGYSPVGLSPYAGYAIGYKAVQSFMNLNHVGIAEATLLQADEIIEQCGLFD
ncbi:DUF2268 domain-containing protein [Paenibacillus lutimineralis]|uniref:DUF2268 domain-containing protein n=1 Tax=Paenibacillus lutimineralis TaxID=2707005 RepID=A0A3S9UU04_9BACL|nr:DUF2268 domain-containing protein [Paenibacillus lutimineralis]AZS13839.1 hypothetical protein EI981_04820 [Paenibacillus lutimineralis]